MKLTYEGIQRIIIEDEEAEAVRKENELYCERENAGDRE